ncbi:SHOCT domain-containing protein [Bacillus toyonensis]|uniref:SHOCT domain-containing protein n=1 Tax=Bacillus thuringiensis TaxID=1428 RepID=UPI001BCFDB71|nr:SHOCT domain-containing protein [Bacillus toyonensis]
MDRICEFKGAEKTIVRIEGNFIRLKRRGALNFFNHGLDGETPIDINNMTGIQIKKANFFTNGYIQFNFMGSQESKRGVMAAAADENTVMFTKREEKMVEEIKEYIESILVNKRKPQVTESVCGADEILKYKDLLDQGIITEEEFQGKKKQLLGI